MASKSDLQAAAVNWTRRASQARAAKLPDSSWKPLFQRDIRGILAGHSPIGDREVNDAIYAATNVSPIKDPQKGHGLLDIVGNIPSDIQNIVTGFPIGVYDYVTTLPHQMGQVKALMGLSGAEEYHQAQQETGIDYSKHDIGTVLRNMARTPVFNFFVPGLQTAANLTDEEGRKQIIEHPVSTAIDVGALASMGGEAGLFGRQAGLAERAAMTTLKEPEYGALLNTETTSPYLRENVYSHPSVNLPEGQPLVDVTTTPLGAFGENAGRLNDLGRQHAPSILKRLNEHIPEVRQQIKTATTPEARTALQANLDELRIARSGVRKLQFIDKNLPMVTTEAGELAVPEWKPTALGALQTGKGLRAAGRVAIKGAEVGTLGAISRPALRQFFLNMGVHPDIVARLSRPYAEIRNRNLAEMNQFMMSDVVAPILKMKEDAPERVLFNRVLGGETALTEAEATMLWEYLDNQGQPIVDRATGPTVASEHQFTDWQGNPISADNIPTHRSGEVQWAEQHAAFDIGGAVLPESHQVMSHLTDAGLPATGWVDVDGNLTDQYWQFRDEFHAAVDAGIQRFTDEGLRRELAAFNDVKQAYQILEDDARLSGRGFGRVGDSVMTDAGRALLADPATDPALREALQKVADNEAYQTAVIPGTDIRLETVGTRAHVYMDYLAKNDPNIVAVREKWEEPYGKEYYYHQSHEVAKAWNAQIEAYANLNNAEKIAVKARDVLKLARDNGLATTGAEESLRKAIERLNEASGKATAARNKYYETFSKRAPASFYGILSEEVRKQAGQAAQAAPGQIARLERQIADLEAQLSTVQRPIDALRIERQIRNLNAELAEIPRIPVQEALNRIAGAIDTETLATAIGPRQAAQLMNDVEATWRGLAEGRGIDPIFLPNVKASRVEHVHVPTVLSESPEAVSHMSKNTAFNLSRSVYDVAVGLVETKRQQLTEAGTREFATRFVRPLTRTSTDAIYEIQDGIRNGGPTTLDVRHQSLDEIDRHYVKWDPKDYGMAAYFPSVEGGDLLLPKGVADSLKRLGREENAWRNPLRARYDKVMKVWRFSVLTTPRHISHVVNGGMMMGMVRDPLMPIQLLTQFKEALAIMRGDDHVLKSRFGGNLNDFETDQLQNLGAAKSIGRIAQVSEKLGGRQAARAVRFVNRMEDSAVQMYKITQMLSEEKYLAKKWDVPVSLVRDEAISRANKMFVDMNAMTPFERTTIRKVFPFYGFTRHLFRYLMTYPSDHPYAAAILTNFAVQHEKDWSTGLPRDFSFMFFLGEPDVDGNVNAVDYRSIDPFRSFYNVFTLAGITSQMNPGFQLLAQQAGVNVLSATPELYPHTHYNPTTGQLEADQPPNLPLRILETIIPPTQAIDARFTLSDQFRNLKINDPEGYRHRIFTSLGIPFSGFPFTLAGGELGEKINVPRKRELTQLKRYTDASNAINEAVRTGDFSKAKRYDWVPTPSLLSPYFPIDYARPGQIEKVYRALEERLTAGTDVSLHAVLPKPSRRRTR